MALAQTIERMPSERAATGHATIAQATVSQATLSQATVAQPRVNAPIDLRQLIKRPPAGELPRGQVVALAPAPAAAAFTPIASSQPVAAQRPAAPVTVKVAAAPIAPQAPEPAPLAERPKSDVAFGLLDKLATAVPTLIERNKTLEAELAVTRAQASADLADAQGRAKALLETTERLKAQVAHFEREIASLTHRARAAEDEVKGFRATADEAQRAAAHAECLSSLFEDKLIAAFGTGSIGHAFLEGAHGLA